MLAGLVALSAPPFPLRAQDPAVRPPLGTLVDIGQRKIHLHCTGSGSPTVVLESGASSFALDWALVQPAVSKTTRVCSYDRAGYGWSDPASAGDYPEQAVRDLRAVLDAARERPPFVLVGASMGGIYTRIFLHRHPGDVAGLVFVDPSHEDRLFVDVAGQIVAIWARTVDQARASLAPREAWAGILARQPARSPQTGAPFDKLPKDLYDARIAFDKRLIADGRVYPYDRYVESEIGRQEAFVLLHEQSSGRKSLGDRPVVVLTRGLDENKDRNDVHAALAAQSTNARHTVIRDAGHEIHLFTPSAVIQAVEDVVEAVRKGTQLPSR
jgi:pimeloyl-ACP methyl ester carboxylesterase